MTWSIQQQLPGTTATERLAAWTYLKDTFIPGLGGWTKTAAHDDVTDADKFSCQRTVLDLVSGATRTEGHIWHNSTFDSGDFTHLRWYPIHLTQAGEVPTDPLLYRVGSIFKSSDFASHLTPADPSHEGFNFCVSDANDHAFLITYNRKLICWFLGFQQVYHWADDGAWFTGARTGYRQAPFERPLCLNDTTATISGGTDTNVSSGSEALVPGISYYPMTSTQLVDYAWAGFPWLSSNASDTDDDVTCVFGTLPNTDVSWVRPYNFPYTATTGQVRRLCADNDSAYQVARSLNGDYQVFWRDPTANTPWAMISFGANDPTA